MSTLTSFLDDFLVNVFHPQLDETLVELSTATFVDTNAFQEDPQWRRVAKQPILKVCPVSWSSYERRLTRER